MGSLKSCTMRVKERIPLTCILHLLHYDLTWRLEVGHHYIEGITNRLTERLRRLSPNVVIFSGGEALVVFKRCSHHSIFEGQEHPIIKQMHLLYYLCTMSERYVAVLNSLYPNLTSNWNLKFKISFFVKLKRQLFIYIGQIQFPHISQLANCVLMFTFYTSGVTPTRWKSLVFIGKVKRNRDFNRWKLDFFVISDNIQATFCKDRCASFTWRMLQNEESQSYFIDHTNTQIKKYKFKEQHNNISSRIML